MREKVSTSAAPAPIGPYSQAVLANGFIFASGQIPLDPATQRFFGVDPPARTTIAVSGLPQGALIEIEVTAAIPLPASSRG